MAELTYTRTNWQDYPEKTTPVNATNLNNIENGIEINKANIDELSQVVNAIDTELDTKEPSISLSPGWTKTLTEKILIPPFDAFIDTTEWSLITDTLTVSKDRVNQYTGTTVSNQTEISADHITTTGSISAKAIALNNDVSITQFSDSFTAEVPADTAPTAQGVVNYVATATANLAPVTDYTDTKFTLTDTTTFTMLHQHIYQVGALVFIHLVFRTNKQIETTGLFTLGKLDDSLLPQHVHSFTVVPANPNATNDMTMNPGYINLDGTISFDVTKTYSSSNYTFDITTFYCTDISTPITTE